MKNLNDNNYQMKGDNQMQMNISNFWEKVSEMNEIHSELWAYRNDSQLKTEPDEGTLEILANCEAIEEALATENESQVETTEYEQYINSLSTEDFIAECKRLLNMSEQDSANNESQVEPVTTEYDSQMEDQFVLEMELERELMLIEMQSQPEWYESGINNIQEYLATDRGSQIEFGDDMDEIDRRNVYRYLDARQAI